MTKSKIKVLIVDNSAVIRHRLTEILNQTDDIEVAGTAQDPLFAMNKIVNLRPDVIILDVEMPRMDGLTFLEKLMKTNPIPVIMVSALTQRGCDTALKALELGAVDYIAKPSIDISNEVVNIAEDIIKKVRMAHHARIRLKVDVNEEVPVSTFNSVSAADRIIAIGASTGGTQAVMEIIAAMPADSPGIVIVQHMPPVFTRSFAERLNSLSRLEVREAQTGDRVLRGTALVAPGSRHMMVKRNGATYYVEIIDTPMVNFVKPSADVLFISVARYAGKNSIGVILTGMGEDGARGLLEMKNAGAFTIAQDEATSVVFGMPRKAIEMGAAGVIAPLDGIAKIIGDAVKAKRADSVQAGRE